MSDFKEVTGTITVPKNVGAEGFLDTVRQLLKRPRVQEIRIDARGKVTFRRFASEDEDDGNAQNNFGVDLTDLQPYHIIRNAQVQEFTPPPNIPASTVIGLMFEKVAQDRLHPLAFVTGPDSSFWEWYRFTTGYAPQMSEGLFGIPFLQDRQIPDTVLLLCAGYGKEASFTDTQVSYKVEMPQYTLPSTDVQVIL